MCENAPSETGFLSYFISDVFFISTYVFMCLHEYMPLIYGYPRRPEEILRVLGAEVAGSWDCFLLHVGTGS